MKNFRSFINVAAFLSVCWMTVFPQTDKPFSIDEAPIPNNGQPINDYANVIDDAVEQQLNQKIKDFKARTNPQVVLAVATVRTTGDRPVFDYSLAVARGWKIGSKSEDNPSALLFVAIDDRKYQTQVSRDLEDELPDGLAGQIQRQYLVPAFRQGDYTKGISDTIDAYIRTIDARRSGTEIPVETPTGQTERRNQRKTGSFSLTSVICCGVILLVLLAMIFGRGKGGRGGRGGWGGRGGGFGDSALPWIIGSVLANSMGNSRDSWGGGGSDWGGGSSGGGDWGGFGGGGDFGGGGAGGDW